MGDKATILTDTLRHELMTLHTDLKSYVVQLSKTDS